jgi:hypothetical protein
MMKQVLLRTLEGLKAGQMIGVLNLSVVAIPGFVMHVQGFHDLHL